MSDLTKARARLAAITPGPWRKGSPHIQCLLKHHHARGQCKYDHIGWYDGNSIHQDRAYNYGPNPDDCEDVDAGLIVGMWDYEEGGIRKAEDADFIAHAPADLAAAFERITELEAALYSIKRNCESAVAGDSYRGPYPFIELIYQRAAELLKGAS